MIQSFNDLKNWLNSFPNQCMGKIGPLTDGGVKYSEYHTTSYARPGNSEEAEASAAIELYNILADILYGDPSSFRIEWRVPLETEIVSAERIALIDPNGPDVDFITNQKCHMDKNWIAAKTYIRFARIEIKKKVA